jgi:hypothetical protein
MLSRKYWNLWCIEAYSITNFKLRITNWQEGVLNRLVYWPESLPYQHISKCRAH